MGGCPKTRIDIFKKCFIERALLDKLLMMMMMTPGVVNVEGKYRKLLGAGTIDDAS